jgi:DNA-binding winged helix-turn-helix (wHTH) protein
MTCHFLDLPMANECAVAVAGPGEPPIIICITGNPADQVRLAGLLAGSGVVLLCPDIPTARDLLGEGARGAPAAPAAVVPEPAPPPVPVPVEGRAVVCGDLVIDRPRHGARWRDSELVLTPLQRDVLGHLAETPGQVWSYALLYETVWRQAYLGDPGSLHSTVKRLRKALRDAGAEVDVEAVRGIGFRLVNTERVPVAEAAEVRRWRHRRATTTHPPVAVPEARTG